MYELTPELKNFDGLDIWNGLRNICDFLDELIKPVARKHGLTVTQLRLLCAVKRTAGVNIAAAANYAGIAAANASSMCKRLSELGFLRRHRSGSDDRVVRLELTDNGNVAAGEAGERISGSCLSGEALSFWEKFSDMMRRTDGEAESSGDADIRFCRVCEDFENTVEEDF